MRKRLHLLVRATLRLAAVGVRLRLSGFSPVQRRLQEHQSVAVPASVADETQATALTWAVACAANLSPLHPSCLTRALTLWSLLGEEGIAGRMCLGARQTPAGLLAHAWVELNGRVLNDASDVAERFPPLTAPQAGGGRRRTPITDMLVAKHGERCSDHAGHDETPSADRMRARTCGNSEKRLG